MVGAKVDVGQFWYPDRSVAMQSHTQQIMTHCVYDNFLKDPAEPSVVIGATLAHLLDQTTLSSCHSQ